MFYKGFYFPACEKNISDFVFLFDSEVLNICNSRVTIHTSNKTEKKKNEEVVISTVL